MKIVKNFIVCVNCNNDVTTKCVCNVIYANKNKRIMFYVLSISTRIRSHRLEYMSHLQTREYIPLYSL